MLQKVAPERQVVEEEEEKDGLSQKSLKPSQKPLKTRRVLRRLLSTKKPSKSKFCPLSSKLNSEKPKKKLLAHQPLKTAADTVPRLEKQARRNTAADKIPRSNHPNHQRKKSQKADLEVETGRLALRSRKRVKMKIQRCRNNSVFVFLT